MRPKHKNHSTPLAGLTVTGAGIEPLPVSAAPNPIMSEDPYTGMTDQQKSTYFLESLLYYAQLNAPTTLSPHSKGIYFLLAYSPLALLGLHKFYIGKCLQGILIQLFTVLLGGISSGFLIPIMWLIIFIWVCVETYRDYTRKTPINDAAGRPLR